MISEDRGAYLLEEEELYWRMDDDIDSVRENLFPHMRQEKEHSERIKDIVTYCIDVYENETMSSCPICLESKRTIDMVTTNCFHQFCFDCVKEHVETLQKTLHTPCCALCRQNYKSFELRDMEKCILLDTLCLSQK